MKTTLLILAVLSGTTAAGTGAAAEPHASPQEDPMTAVPAGIVDGATAQRLAHSGAVIVDVRTPQEYAAGHVPGAKNVPHDRIRERAEEIGPPSTPVVVYCRSGQRSAVAAGELRRLGYAKVWDAQRYDAFPKNP